MIYRHSSRLDTSAVTLLQKGKKIVEATGAQGVRVAFLGYGTTTGFAEVLVAQCYDAGISISPFVTPYNQVAQMILSPDSALYAFEPDVVIVWIDAREMLGEWHENSARASDDDRRAWLHEKKTEVHGWVSQLRERTRATIIVHTLVPPSTSLGILERRAGFTMHDAVASFNEQLVAAYRDTQDVYVFDYGAWLTRVGGLELVDPKLYYLADIRVTLPTFARLCNEYVGYIIAVTGKTKKCLVLDLDNTLWGGIVGEDGITGIALGPTPDGRPFWELQNFLLGLQQRGVLLAINSKNNSDDALSVLRDHPHMILREEHFASIRINWQDKASNMREIAQELNLGLDSFVFLDDDPVNRHTVATVMPEVTVIDVPKDPSKYLEIVRDLPFFQTASVTAEDMSRGQMYAHDRKRRQLFEQAADVGSYLKGLHMVASIAPVTDLTLPRVAQLVKKTNQFNLTTKRYTEVDLVRFVSDPRFQLWTVSVRDRFGDNGLTGVAIVEAGENEWRIDSFLLSCRVIGRRIESALLGVIINQARQRGVSVIVGERIPTPKNEVTKEFYKNHGFLFEKKGEMVERWRYDIQGEFSLPDIIHIDIETG